MQQNNNPAYDLKEFLSYFKLFFKKKCNPKEYVAAHCNNEVLLQMESWEIIGIMV